MLKLDWDMQKRSLAAAIRGKNLTGWYWVWGDYGIPWAEPEKYWMWGLGWFTLVVYDGRLWSLQSSID